MPHSGPSANRFSYSSAHAQLVADAVDVLAADGARHAARARLLARRRQLFRRRGSSASSNVPALKVARRQRAEAVEREQIGRGAELAVLRGGRTERAFRQVAAERGELARVRPLAPLRAAHGDRLDVLGAEHRAAAAAAGVAAVVRDRGVAHPALAGRADRRDLEVGAEPRAAAPLPSSRQVAPRRDRRRVRAARSPSSMTSTESSGARPTITMASQPRPLPAIAKPLLASESLMRSVSGLLLTTANFAEVVSGLPTSGLNAKTTARLGEQRSGAIGLPAAHPMRRAAIARPGRCRQEVWRKRVSSSGTRSAARPRRRRAGRSRDNRRKA